MREIKYPQEVESIHEKYIDAIESSIFFIHVPNEHYPNSATTAWALFPYGPGGGPTHAYNSNYSTKLTFKATLQLIELLEEYGIKPY